MPMFRYICPTHGEFTKLLKSREKTFQCDKCGAESKNILKAGTVQVMERLDNGLMARAVERYPDIEELNKKDAEADEQRYKDKMDITEDEET